MKQTKKEQEIIDNLKTMYNNGYIDKEFRTIIKKAEKINIVSLVLKKLYNLSNTSYFSYQTDYLLNQL